LAAVWLTSCTIVGPVVDPALETAEERACLDMQAASANSCIQIFRRNPQGGFSPAELTTLQAGDEIFASKSSECAGTFNRAVVIADVQGPGSATLAVTDAIGRQTPQKRFSWDESRAGKRMVVNAIHTPLQIPGNVHFTVHEGTVDVRNICFANYR
jgi:hypothetical protein